MSTTAFAIVDDIVDRWRPLTSAETLVAEFLLDDASDMIRSRWPDTDNRLEDGSLTDLTLIRVTVAMVRRALLNAGQEGVESFAQTTGPFSTNAKYVNPAGNLYFSADDIRALTLNGYQSTARMGWLA